MAKLFYLALIPLIYLGITHLLHVFYFAGTFCESRVSLNGKTVIVTGANTGIGKTTALDMAARGARVILACRSEKRTLPAVKEIKEKTKNDQVLFMELDLASFASVQKFSDAFLRNEERLDILINNAGMFGGSEAKLNSDGIEITLMVNHLSHFLLTQNLLDLLKKSGPGSRIINVSSHAHDMANPTAFKNLDDLLVDGTAEFPSDFDDVTDLEPLEPNFILDYLLPEFALEYIFTFVMKPEFVRYSNSKLANVLYTAELARRLKGSGVTTYSLHPGVIRTEIGVDRNSGKSPNFLVNLWGKIPDVLNPILFFFKTLEGGAQTTVCCAVSELIGEAESGAYFSECKPLRIKRKELKGDLPAKFFDWSQSVVDKALGKK